MSDQLQERQRRAVELLELHDASDRLDQELRVRTMVLRFTPLVSILMAAPLFVVLFVNEAPFLAASSTFLIVLGAVLYAVTLERRRLEEEREAIRSRIRRMEDEMAIEKGAPP